MQFQYQFKIFNQKLVFIISFFYIFDRILEYSLKRYPNNGLSSSLSALSGSFAAYILQIISVSANRQTAVKYQRAFFCHLSSFLELALYTLFTTSVYCNCAKEYTDFLVLFPTASFSKWLALLFLVHSRLD